MHATMHPCSSEASAVQRTRPHARLFQERAGGKKALEWHLAEEIQRHTTPPGDGAKQARQPADAIGGAVQKAPGHTA